MSELRETAPAYETAAPPPRGKISFEEFLAWCGEDTRAEWVDGEVVVLTPSARKHQRISALISTLLREFALARDLGEVLSAPFLVRLPEDVRRGREPDIFFVRKDRLPLLKETYFDGAPDLIVEITSPESFARDRGEKYLEYEASGVAEYWLVDPDRRQAEFYHLGENRRYRMAAVGQDGIFRSAAMNGFWLRVDWLWREPPPSAINCLKEMGII